MSQGRSTTPDMQQNPPPESPSRSEPVPARPAEVPMLPTRRWAPGRQAPLPDPVAVHRLEVPDSAPPYDGEQDHAGPDRGHAGAREPEPQAPPGEAADAPAKPGWPSQFAQVLAETLAGSRPASQLTPWTTEQTRRQIQRLGPMLSTGQRPRIRRIMTSAPSHQVLELTAVVGFGSRMRVLAVRLERANEHWRCTAIESA